MRSSHGIPTIADLDALKQTEEYQQHLRFNGEFLTRHHNAMAGYGRHWGKDPFQLWSRRWEYPYVARRLLEYASRNNSSPLKILDAGSGVTYFPYFIQSQVSRAQFICCDYDASYTPMFDRIGKDRGTDSVQFLQCMLQKIPLEDKSLDAICCISVLEHTDNYGEIVREFSRVLKDGGLLVLTFDLSLDGKFTLPKPMAVDLLTDVSRWFDLPDGFDFKRELDRMEEAGILTTDHVRRTEPNLLPWSFPVRVYKAAQDLIGGKGWTMGFRSRTVFCIEAFKKRS